MSVEKQALEGLKVADFTWVAAAPFAMKYLADHGATVVRVESMTRPDIFRVEPPFKDNKPGINRSGWYASYNPGKYSLSLDLKNPKGVEVARKLVMWADLMAENFTPGVMEKLGLDYLSVSKLKPDIIYFSSSGMGITGPSARHSRYGNHISSQAGITHVTGWPDRDGVMPHGGYTDVTTPAFAVVAIMAALEYRRRTGRGQHVDMSQLEVGAQFLIPLFIESEINGREWGRVGNKDPNACPHGVYPCMGPDRWCAIAVFNDEQWNALQRTMGNPSWAGEDRFATLIERKRNEDKLDHLISCWTSQYDAGQLMEQLQRLGVPAGVVQTTKDLFGDPQLRHRNHYVRLHHPEIGEHSYEAPAFTLSKTPGKPRSPAPCLGQHNDLVLKEFLEMTDEEIKELVVSRALA